MQASGALIDVVEGCHDALNLIEDGFDVDTSRSIHRLQGVMSETMYSIANKMEPESVRLQNRLTAKAVELDNIIVREERWMPADRDPAQEEYLFDFSQVSKVTVSSAFSDRHRGGGSVVSALDVSSPQPMASALGGGGDGGGSAVLTLGRYHAAGIGGVEAELAQREREALAEVRAHSPRPRPTAVLSLGRAVHSHAHTLTHSLTRISGTCRVAVVSAAGWTGSGAARSGEGGDEAGQGGGRGRPPHEAQPTLALRDQERPGGVRSVEDSRACGVHR
jgi:hypothetical protein